MAFEIFKLFGSIFVDTSEANNEMDRAGNNAEILGKKFGAVAKTADNISDGLKGLGKGFSTYVTAPLTAIGTGAVLAFNAVDDGMDVMLKATGATGDAANGLEKIFKNVSGSVIGSFDDVGGAIGEVNTRFGVTGDGLETMSRDFLKFAEITGVDATQGVALVSRAMSDAGIDTKDYKKVLDQLSAASQASGISVEALTENLTKYGAPMRALGFDTQESIAIFAGWEKAGVNTEIAFSGMKKAISNWAAAGKDPREEFKKTLKAIEETPDIASATTMYRLRHNSCRHNYSYRGRELYFRPPGYGSRGSGIFQAMDQYGLPPDWDQRDYIQPNAADPHNLRIGQVVEHK